MIPHFQERAAALESLGWTSRDAEWLALVCLHSGVFLRAQYLAFLGHGHRESATRFVERYRAWCGRQAGRRAPVERAWRGSTRLCMVAPWSLYRALGAEHVRHRREGVASGGAAAAAAVARLRARKPDGAVAGDRGGEGRRADRGGRPRRGVAAPRLSGRVRLPPALLRAQAAARAGRGARDVRVRPGGGRDAERRPHVGRDARRLWTALCAAGLAVEVVVVGRDPERLAAAEPVLAGWTRAPAAPDGGAERSGEAARGAEAELAAVRAAVARGDLAALETYAVRRRRPWRRVGCSRATGVARRAGRRCARATRRGARPDRRRRRGAWVAAASASGRRWRARATRHQRTAVRPAVQATSRPSWTIKLDPPPDDHLDGHRPFEALGRVVLQLLDLAAGLEDPEVLFDAPAQDVPAQDLRGVGGAGHGQRGQHEPFQRLGRGRRMFLARMDDPQLDRRGPGARQRHLPVAQCHVGDARRPAVFAGLFAGLHPRAQPLHLDRAGAAGGRVAHLVEQTARDRMPVGRLLRAHDAVDLRPGPAVRPAGRARGAR